MKKAGLLVLLAALATGCAEKAEPPSGPFARARIPAGFKMQKFDAETAYYHHPAKKVVLGITDAGPYLRDFDADVRAPEFGDGVVDQARKFGVLAGEPMRVVSKVGGVMTFDLFGDYATSSGPVLATRRTYFVKNKTMYEVFLIGPRKAVQEQNKTVEGLVTSL